MAKVMKPFFAYEPESTQEIYGQEDAVISINRFLKQFKKGKGLFLYGPTGTGKTSIVHAYAKEHDWDILELNASDTRNQKELTEFLNKATGQASLFGNKKIILLDEIDGLSGTKDRGAATAIAKTIATSSFPIIITGVNVFDKKFSSIKKVCTLVEFARMETDAIIKGLEATVQREKLDITTKDIRAIARNAAGDMRAALNDLFAFVIIASSKVGDTAVRKQTEDIATALIRVFKSTKANISLGAFDNVNEDLDKIFLWVDQNIPTEYKKAQDIDKAYETLALADKFFGRIRRWQYYRFYVYCYLLLTAGIALSKEEKYISAPRYKQPTRLLKYWQANMTYAKRKSIVEKLAERTRLSAKTCLKESFHTFLPVLARNKNVQEELDLTSDEIAWLKKYA